MVSGGRRINGWKSIGAHFGRDRTTAIRWANERGLPVHRVPGGKAASVFAFEGELDAWLNGQDASGSDAGSQPATGSRRHRALAIGLGATALAVFLGAASLLLPGTGQPVPRDEATARIYVEARDAWALRTRESLARAIAGLEQVIRREPDFAPAYTALADAYLLSFEFGSLPKDVAYPRAKQAAERGLALDSDLAEAHRALGFVLYWWEREAQEAGRSFRRALTLDPDAAQTRFWYANILADNGEQAAAMREFDAARLGNPGSASIRTDRAWALWSGGDTTGAVHELRAVLDERPSMATAHDCLADIALGEGDFAGYVHHLREREALRSEPGLRDHLAALENALAQGDVGTVKGLIVARAMNDEEGSAFPDHAFAAFAASAGGDRPGLLRILRLADAGGERWGSAGYVRRIAARWRGDSQITALLRARRGPRIERKA